MSDIKLKIEIASGKWALNVIRHDVDDDDIVELKSPSSFVVLDDFQADDVYIVNVAVVASPGTPFKVFQGEKVILEAKTGANRAWSGYTSIFS